MKNTKKLLARYYSFKEDFVYGVIQAIIEDLGGMKVKVSKKNKAKLYVGSYNKAISDVQKELKKLL